MSVETITQPKDKFLLTVEEASDYFGIGQKKLRQIIVANPDAGIIIQCGVKYLIKRQRFEEYLDKLTAI